MRKLLIIVAALGVVATYGCARATKEDDFRSPMLSKLPFVYQMPVQQGNIITEDMVDQLQLGMSKSQVRYVLGTPLLTDMFHTNRWDYTYTMRRSHSPMEIKRLTLYFEEDALSRIDGAMQPDPDRALEAEEAREVVVEVPDWKNNRGLINRTLNAIGVEPEN